MKETKEKQYKVYLENFEKNGFSRLGLGVSFGWEADPLRLVISSSRYKFVSKILQGKKMFLKLAVAMLFILGL
jgi:hypothetical protein